MWGCKPSIKSNHNKVMEVHFFYVFKMIPKTAWQTDITFSMQYLALVIH
jgi:hypothetical protein